jgi:hypothetical protein
MMTRNESIILFLFGCVPTRIFISIIPLLIEKKHLPYYGLILLMPAIGFLLLYFFNLRLNATEAGGKTWWSNYRLIDGLLYLAAAIYCFQEKAIAYIPLLIDVVFGLIIFIIHNFINRQFI